MADDKKNRFNALSGKDKCDETECQSLENTVAEAVEEALNNENDQKSTVSAKQPTRGKKKTGPPSTTPTGQDGAMIGDVITRYHASHRGYPADGHKVGDHGGYGGSGDCIPADARGASGGRDNERGSL